MARLDTGWHAHPRILALSVAGMAVHAWSISYCDAVLSDGFIPNGAWPSKRGFVSGVKEVVAAGLWRLCDGGYQLHDYTDYNRTKAQVLAQREDDRFRKMSGRKSAGHAPDSAGIPRAPVPGPGLTLAAAAAAAAETPGLNSAGGRDDPGARTPTHAREATHDLRPLGDLLTPLDREPRQQQQVEQTLPDEVRERLARAPIPIASQAC